MALVISVGAVACGNDDQTTTGRPSGDGVRGATGEIRIDGSRPVGEITQAVADSYGERNPGVEITVGLSGVDSGFERLCAGETAINDASRPIDPEEEDLCAEDNIVAEEIQAAHEALAVVVNRRNPVDCLTVAQLAEIWGEDAVSSWEEVTNLEPEFSEEIERVGPGNGSRTFDYFSEAINGEEGEQTRDYEDVEEDAEIVAGVRASEGAIGYLDLTSYLQNPNRLKALEIENERGRCVPGSIRSVQDSSYNPLGRAFYIYAAYDEARSQPVSSFLAHYVDNVSRLARELGFIALTAPQLRTSQETVARITGGQAGAQGGRGTGASSG